ncbi:PIN domain protein [uncultured archaeon]|nr:PIN domain protein [uncultured archaeon]
MIRIVADTNLLISSIFWSGPPFLIVQQALDGRLEIVVSALILNEVRKVLTNPDEGFVLSEQEVDDVVNGILAFVTVVEPSRTFPVSRDPEDDSVIACALASKANFIVTRDKDLLVLKEYSGIKMVTPEEFLRLNAF